jgi:hypothetical protein
MKVMNKSVRFDSAGVTVAALLVGTNAYLEIGEHGKLVIPDGVEPTGFNILVVTREGSRKIVVQRDLGQIGGSYATNALSNIGTMPGFNTVVMNEPIEVVRQGANVWTRNSKDVPNRLDIWSVGENGETSLFQVGIVTHDDGLTWTLLGEYAWCGQLYYADSKIVGKPSEPAYGSFDVRKTILTHPDFVALVESAHLEEWTGSTSALTPKMSYIPEDHGQQKFARLAWYKVFMGQSGQGIAVLPNGEEVWVHGADLQITPDKDGIKRPGGYNTCLTYQRIAKFGKGQKLIGVRVTEG